MPIYGFKYVVAFHAKIYLTIHQRWARALFIAHYIIVLVKRLFAIRAVCRLLSITLMTPQWLILPVPCIFHASPFAKNVKIPKKRRKKSLDSWHRPLKKNFTLKTRAGHATILPRQRDHAFRPQSCYCSINMFVVATPSRHRDLNICLHFSGP